MKVKEPIGATVVATAVAVAAHSTLEALPRENAERIFSNIFLHEDIIVMHFVVLFLCWLWNTERSRVGLEHVEHGPF